MSDLCILSDALSELKSQFHRCGHGGVFVSSDEAIQLAQKLDALTRHARKLENEVSRYRWNEAARQEREQAKAIVEAVMDKGSNVLFFPACERPFGDGDA